MFVQFLGIETKGKYEFVHEPKPPQIEKAIRALDGDKHTYVVLEASPATHLTVGGGLKEQCVLAVVIENKQFFRLINPAPLENPGEHMRMKVAASEGVYTREMLISKDQAIAVAKPFADKGKFDDSLQWKVEQLEG